MQYCERYIPVSMEAQGDYMNVIATVEDSLKTAMQPNQNIVLVNLIMHLRNKQIAIASAEDASDLRIKLIGIITLPLKSVLGSHHFEKQFALEILATLLKEYRNDSKALAAYEKSFGSRLFCKANEPQKLQLRKLGLLMELQRLTGSEKLLDELLFQTRASFSQIKV